MCSVKDSMKRMERQVTAWEKIRANHMTDKGSAPRIQGELSTRNVKTSSKWKMGRRHAQTFRRGCYTHTEQEQREFPLDPRPPS